MAKNRKRKSRSLSGAKSIELRDDLGNFLRRVTEDELQHMLSRHAAIRRVGKTVYAEMPQVLPSNSGTTKAELTGGSVRSGDGGDMHLLAGMCFSGGKLGRRTLERLMGHFVIEDRLPAAKSERIQTRAMYFDAPAADMATA